MSAGGRARIGTLILIISAVTWVMLLVNPRSMTLVHHHPMTDSEVLLASSQTLLAMNSILSLMAGWALMLVAMMSPTLIAPIYHIIERSFTRRRARSVTLFVMGYAVIWMAVGVVLIAITLVLNQLMPQSYLPVIVVGIIAFVWQCSPIKQRCLNRNHNHRELAAFGIAADLDVLHFGVMHGVWCVGSCWALMLLPMMVSQGHFAAMAVVTFMIISEHLEQPKPAHWHLRISGKLMRILVAQTRIYLQRVALQKLF